MWVFILMWDIRDSLLYKSHLNHGLYIIFSCKISAFLEMIYVAILTFQVSNEMICVKGFAGNFIC